MLSSALLLSFPCNSSSANGNSNSNSISISNGGGLFNKEDLLAEIQQHRIRLKKSNPDEYTIGGVLSGTSDVGHYFSQILSVSLDLTNLDLT